MKFKQKARSVDFNPKLEAHLKEMDARREQKVEWLFPSTRDEGDRVKEYGHDLAKVTEKAGLSDVTSHYFRHYFIPPVPGITCNGVGVAVNEWQSYNR